MKSVGVLLFLLCFHYPAGCLFFVIFVLCVSVGAWMCVMFLVSRFFDECFNHTCNNGGSSVDGVSNYRCKWKPDSCRFLRLLFFVLFCSICLFGIFI